ncbi:mannose-6-phosphate isomerase, class I [Salimicrobium halophilum]|uniref:Mannose-6-phosphate isomerase n=1 Tax=Salimicrobium halophilum TaxID=86666 RepID=A0A1G8S1P9_9BACI|nr:mannose-6-phosphate isomerase, class I [Salimicrobium halophilum]SDJ23194.1 mannose-6-phosphate isomerase, type 1 [Salimicrobium halophilum]
MYQQPMMLKPLFKERIWGGTNLRDMYGYAIPSPQTGECWAISGHESGTNEIANGPLAGSTIREAWDNHRELFADEEGEEFPLLTKILDANKDLSVQVHPGDTYAREKEDKTYGKTECWYVIDADEDAEVVLGHHAETKEELNSYIENGQWNDLLRRVKVKSGDFFYVPSGTIHAIGAGVRILETQQNSDITYRVYDYDRIGQDGEKRELHLEQSVEVTTVPHKDPDLERKTNIHKGMKQELLVSESYFSVEHWDIHGMTYPVHNPSYLLFSVLEGDVNVWIEGEAHPVEKGTHFIIPATVEKFTLEGTGTLIVSRSNKQ